MITVHLEINESECKWTANVHIYVILHCNTYLSIETISFPSCSVLKSIEFPGSAENSSQGGAVDGVKPKSLEMLLMEKNRTLQTENTQLKLANTEVTGEGAWGAWRGRGVPGGGVCGVGVVSLGVFFMLTCLHFI